MDRRNRWLQHLPLAILPVMVSASLTSARQLEPRFFSNSPAGLNAVALGFTRSGGNILLVPSLPLLWFGLRCGRRHFISIRGSANEAPARKKRRKYRIGNALDGA